THELKAPLTGMRALTELLHDGVVTDEPKRREYYAAMLGECDRLAQLVQNVLTAARLERGALPLALVSLEPAPLLREVASGFARRLETLGYRFEVDVPDGLPRVRADRDAFLGVVTNLLDNAAKYGAGSERS